MILMSSLSEQERRTYRLSDEMPFLQKPFSVETMLQMVHMVLGAIPLAQDQSAPKPITTQNMNWYG